ncbi:MAG: hypothetical protein WAN32_12220, partial [Candidatus Acidiferrum sp.]
MKPRMLPGAALAGGFCGFCRSLSVTGNSPSDHCLILEQALELDLPLVAALWVVGQFPISPTY